MKRRLKVAQFRLSGMHEGTRILAKVEGEHRWMLDCFLLVEEDAKKRDGREYKRTVRVSRIMTTDKPCLMSQLHPIYDAVISELCQEHPVVRGGGWCAYLLPPGVQA